MKYRIPVSSDFVRTFKDPNHPNIRLIHAYVGVNDLPKNLPLDSDPRRPKEKGEVPKRILSSLQTGDGRFHLLNRGITISCKSSDYDNKTGVLSIVVPDADGLYGIIDGGHTY